MSSSLSEHVEYDNVSAIVTDVEGTTSSISFVLDVLFPYAYEHVSEFLRQHHDDPEIRELIDGTRRESGEAGADLERVTAILRNWIKEDRKVTPLKALQGHIWKAGFEDGTLRGHIYPDALQNLKDWHAAGFTLYVYSSGSVAAQQLLFRHSEAGDLSFLFSGNFDTGVGGKKEKTSYDAIAESLQLPPGEILFLSDVLAELDAAQSANLQTAGLDRDNSVSDRGDHTWVATFDAVQPHPKPAA